MLEDACGNRVNQRVEYEWLPVSRKHCKVFGHSDAKCTEKLKLQQRWVIKSNLYLDEKSEIEEVMESSEHVIINNTCEAVMEKGKLALLWRIL